MAEIGRLLQIYGMFADNDAIGKFWPGTDRNLFRHTLLQNFPQRYMLSYDLLRLVHHGLTSNYRDI